MSAPYESPAKIMLSISNKRAVTSCIRGFCCYAVTQGGTVWTGDCVGIATDLDDAQAWVNGEPVELSGGKVMSFDGVPT